MTVWYNEHTFFWILHYILGFPHFRSGGFSNQVGIRVIRPQPIRVGLLSCRHILMGTWGLVPTKLWQIHWLTLFQSEGQIIYAHHTKFWNLSVFLGYCIYRYISKKSKQGKILTVPVHSAVSWHRVVIVFFLDKNLSSCRKIKIGLLVRVLCYRAT